MMPEQHPATETNAAPEGSTTAPSPSRDIADLLALMAALRTPGSGCAWDLAQTFATIAPYTIEEAYEVADAIARDDMADLVDELGDLLLQVVFHARMAQERGAFAFPDVVEAITAKLIRRHPHVFGAARGLAPDEVKALWARIKQDEKAARGKAETSGALDGVPVALPALARAEKLQAKASRVGFDWNDPAAVLAKLKEETREVEDAIAAGDRDAIQDEIGDVLFVVANLARHFAIDPETALQGTNAKFIRRFSAVEAALADQGVPMGSATLAQMDALWTQIKTREHADKT